MGHHNHSITWCYNHGIKKTAQSLVNMLSFLWHNRSLKWKQFDLQILQCSRTLGQQWSTSQSASTVRGSHTMSFARDAVRLSKGTSMLRGIWIWRRDPSSKNCEINIIDIEYISEFVQNIFASYQGKRGHHECWFIMKLDAKPASTNEMLC